MVKTPKPEMFRNGKNRPNPKPNYFVNFKIVQTRIPNPKYEPEIRTRIAQP